MENKPAPPVMEGGKLDIDSLYSIFAMKSKPDETIIRIEALENQAKQMLERHDAADKVAINSCDRLTALEAKVNENHEKRIKTLEDDLTALRTSISNMSVGPTTTGGNVDTSAIMMKIDMINVEVNKKIDVLVVNSQMDNQWGKLKDLIDGLTLQMQKNQDAHNHALDMLRAEFEHHKNKDFAALIERVAALEKRLNGLTTIVNNLKSNSGGEPSTGGVDEERFKALVDRVDRLEAELHNLSEMFSKWQMTFQDDLNTKADKTALAELE
jgi:hypothetical protein